MKIIQVRLARSIWLFDLGDLNPRGKDISEDLIDWIKDNYDFKIAPDPRVIAGGVSAAPAVPGNQAPSGIEFQRGHFQAREEIFIEINKLTLYNDGIVIDTSSSTADSDRFAQDLLQSAARDFALAFDDETVRKRLYLSELIVRSELSFDLINPRLAAFSRRIEESMIEVPKPQFQIGGLSFWSEPNDAGQHRVFALERQLGKAVEDRRYFSRAPLTTDEHFKLLKELEQILTEHKPTPKS
jgi:hypothetical protein